MEDVVAKRIVKTYGLLMLGVVILLASVYVIISFLAEKSTEVSTTETPFPDVPVAPTDSSQADTPVSDAPTTQPQVSATPEDESSVAREYESPFEEVRKIIVAEEEMGDVEADDESAVYHVEYVVNWSERTHPNWYPKGAHVSPLVVWTHVTTDNEVYAFEETANRGTEVMAETGGTKEIKEVLDGLKETRNVLDYKIGERIDVPGQYDKLFIRADVHSPYVTAVSMIAPSPDWFVAVESVPLYNNGDWVNHIEVPLTLYDAGTDSGTEFNSRDRETPQGPDRIITKKDEIPVSLGFIRFTLFSDN